MNERIKELQFQAAAQVNPLLEGSEWQQVFVENFAELIVRECADVADCTGMAFPVNGWVVGDKIRKHFGVEE